MTRTSSALLCLLTLACDPDACPTPATTTGETSGAAVTGDASSTTGAEEPPTVGDFCDEKADCVAIIETDAGAFPLRCLLPWGYCTMQCQTDSDCSVFDYEFGSVGSGVWTRFTCKDFAGAPYCGAD